MKRFLTLSGIALFALLLIGAVVVGPPSSSGGGSGGSVSFMSNGVVISTTATNLNFIGLAKVTNNPSGSISIDASSNPGPMTQTNFVLNTVYSNANANPILLCVKVFRTSALVNGAASISLMVSYTNGAYAPLAGYATSTLLTGGLADSETNTLGYVITNQCTYYLTNDSVGSGNSSGLISGTGQLTVFGGVGAAGAAGATGATGATGNGVPSTNAPVYTAAINGGLGSTNIVIDMKALGATNAVRATLTANVGLMFTNVIDGFQITLVLVQDTTGNWSISTNATWGFNIRLGTDITGLTLTTNAGYHDYVKIFGDGTNAILNGFVRGYAP